MTELGQTYHPVIELYWDADLLVDGAVEQTEMFTDEESMLAWVKKIEADYNESDSPVEVFLIEHGHAPLGDGE